MVESVLLLMADMSGVRADGVVQGEDSVKVDAHVVMLDTPFPLYVGCTLKFNVEVYMYI